MSVNLFCKNQKCKSAFNFTSIFNESRAERIGKAPGWFKYPQVYNDDNRQDWFTKRGV
jgi:hypothetical protein